MQTEESKTPAGALLRKAAVIVDGERNQIHGHKERSFKAIGALWTSYLENRKVPNGPVTGADATVMLVLLKFARAQHGEYTEDHAVDAAGYAAIFGELRAAEQREAEAAKANAPRNPWDAPSGIAHITAPQTPMINDFVHRFLPRNDALDNLRIGTTATYVDPITGTLRDGPAGVGG